jgi:hypothetical protein
MNLFAFHLTKDLRELVNATLLSKGYSGETLYYTIPEFCGCGNFLGLDYEKTKQVHRDGYADYILTCYGCGKVKHYKKYCKSDLPQHYMLVKNRG